MNQIRGLTKIENWRHCPGELNPADLPTRGVSGKQLVDNELWWQGPVFFKNDILLTSTSEKSLEIEIDEVKRIVEKELARPTRSHAFLT